MPIQAPPSVTLPTDSEDLPPTSIFLRPSLLWPSAWWPSEIISSKDLGEFPNQSERAQRRDARRTIGSVEFRSALKGAARLWILDPHFDGPSGVAPLAEALLDATIQELKINGMRSMSKQDVVENTELFREILTDAARGGLIPEVQWRNTLSGQQDLELHDRFAIIDNELWHFGATVGGAHRSINAFSRGWDANEKGAITYFEQMWTLHSPG